MVILLPSALGVLLLAALVDQVDLVLPVILVIVLLALIFAVGVTTDALVFRCFLHRCP